MSRCSATTRAISSLTRWPAKSASRVSNASSACSSVPPARIPADSPSGKKRPARSRASANPSVKSKSRDRRGHIVVTAHGVGTSPSGGTGSPVSSCCTCPCSSMSNGGWCPQLTSVMGWNSASTAVTKSSSEAPPRGPVGNRGFFAALVARVSGGVGVGGRRCTGLGFGASQRSRPRCRTARGCRGCRGCRGIVAVTERFARCWATRCAGEMGCPRRAQPQAAEPWESFSAARVVGPDRDGSRCARTLGGGNFAERLAKK